MKIERTFYSAWRHAASCICACTELCNELDFITATRTVWVEQRLVKISIPTSKDVNKVDGSNLLIFIWIPVYASNINQNLVFRCLIINHTFLFFIYIIYLYIICTFFIWNAFLNPLNVPKISWLKTLNTGSVDSCVTQRTKRIFCLVLLFICGYIFTSNIPYFQVLCYPCTF